MISNMISLNKAPPSCSDLDTHLAQWHIKLTKIYKNDDGNHLIYIAPSGATIPLTPAMVLDRACALVCNFINPHQKNLIIL